MDGPHGRVGVFDRLGTTAPQQPTGSVMLALCILVLLAIVPFMHPRGGQQASRYAATAALWDQGTFEITAYRAQLFRDGTAINEIIYSDKAPGQPVLAVPFYGVYRIAGGNPFSVDTPSIDWGLWWVTIWSAGLPVALLAMLMYRWVLEIEPSTAIAATLAISFGTLLLVYGTLLFGHVLAALLAFGMFLLVRDPDATARRLVIAGILGGLAVLVEFPVVLIVGIVTGSALLVHRIQAWWILAGGLPALVGLGAYNYRLFESPFVVSYQWNVFSGIRTEAGGILDPFAGPSIERLVHVLFSERGLLVATPIVLMGLIGVVLLWRRGSRIDTGVALLSFLALLAIQVSWSNSYAGGAGPRYLTPALPFLAAPLALAWKRWRLPTAGLAGVSILTVGAATTTIPQLASDLQAGLGFWLAQLFDGNTAPTVYTQWLGPPGWLVHIVSLAVAASALAWIRAQEIA